jgi:putative membrane protein
MRTTTWHTLILAGATLCAQGLVPAWAQSPNGAAGGPPMSQPSQPGLPNSPSMNDPAAHNGTPETMGAPASKADDAKFVKEAAMGGLLEVQLGKLAQEKGSSDAVKQFGKKMVDDHMQANDELKQLTAKNGMQIPDALDSKHQGRIDKLSKLSGADFDKAYVKDQLKDHQEDVKQFKMEAQNGSNADVKGFAAKTLPVLQDHLQMVKTLNKGK